MEELQVRRERILEIAHRHGAANVRVFGSAARGDDRDDSDVDLLVAVSGKTSPWFPAGLILDLEEELHRSIDVVTDHGLNPRIRDRVLSEAKPL
ncbi:nucleotidyltransferase family protein [Endothiovibrio diazotrophicus]